MKPYIAFLMLLLLVATIQTESIYNDDLSDVKILEGVGIENYNLISDNNINLDQVSLIVYDGIVSVDEYSIQFPINSNFNIYYSTDATTLYMALVAVATGYVTVGFGSSVMRDSDIIIGYFDGTTNIMDTWGQTYSALIVDAQQDVIDSAAGETAGVTTLEFSRLLDTGDTAEDNIITIGTTTDIIWGYSASDDYVSYHASRGSTTIVFSGPPSAPQNLVGIPLSSQVDLSWDVPASDGGSIIQSYNIYRSDISNVGYSLIGSSATQSYSDNTVTNDQTYYYIVRGVNSMGEGSNSNEILMLPTQSIPEPLNLVAIAGTGQVTLSWEPPASDGGSSIIHYNIYRSTTSGSGYTLVGQNTSALGFVDNDVVNAFWYYYVVTAVNSFSEGAFSLEDSAFPTGAPSPPLSLTTITGSGNVTLNWTEPISDGGFPITHYTVYRSLDEPGGPYTELGLNNSALGYFDYTAIDTLTYYYVVVANNSAGGSEFSNEQKATLLNVPFASAEVDLEAIFNLTSSLSSVLLNWSAVDPNGNLMIHYNVYRSEIDGVTGTLIGSSTNGSVLNFTDLTTSSGIKYYYLVAGVNTQGEGAYSAQFSVTTGTTPGDPQNVVITPGNSQIKIKWDGVIEDGGLQVQNYHIYSSFSDTGPFTYSSTTPQKTIVIESLNNGQTYYFKVLAENLKGNGTFSTHVSVKPGSKPSEVLNVNISIQNNKINLNWSIPLNNGGYDITEYRMFWSTTNGTSYSFIGINSSSLGFETSNGIVGVTYYFVIRSVNTIGESIFSDEKSISLSEIPSAPRNLTGLAGNTQVLLVWNNSETTGGTPIIQYQVFRSDLSGEGYELIGSVVGNLSYVDNNVANSLTYFYVVNSQNVVGDSDYSNEVSLTPFDPNPLDTSSNLGTSTGPIQGQTDSIVDNPGDSGSEIDISSRQLFITLGFFASITMIIITIRFLGKPNDSQ